MNAAKAIYQDAFLLLNFALLWCATMFIETVTFKKIKKSGFHEIQI